MWLSKQIALGCGGSVPLYMCLALPTAVPGAAQGLSDLSPAPHVGLSIPWLWIPWLFTWK